MRDLQSIRYGFRGAVARWFEVPAARVLAAVGFTPNRATLAGLLIAGLAAYMASTGQFILAGVFVLVGSLFDLLDGALARRLGITERSGALLDSVADRVSEAAVLLGLLVHFTSAGTASQTGAILAFVAFTGSIMVSYVRARAEGLGLKGTAGFLTRTERVVVTAGTLLAGYPIAGLWILAVGTPISALHRFWVEWRAADN